MGDAQSPGAGKKRAPVDFSTVNKKKKGRDPGYIDGIVNYLQDAEYNGCKYNQLKVRTCDLTNSAFDDPEGFAATLESDLTIGKVKYMEPKEPDSTVGAKPGLLSIDIYSKQGLLEAKDAVERMLQVNLAKTGGHWTVRTQKLRVVDEADKIKLVGPSRMLFNHLLAIRNDAKDTGKWNDIEKAWIISYADGQDKDAIMIDLEALTKLVGFELMHTWCTCVNSFLCSKGHVALMHIPLCACDAVQRSGQAHERAYRTTRTNRMRAARMRSARMRTEQLASRTDRAWPQATAHFCLTQSEQHPTHVARNICRTYAEHCEHMLAPPYKFIC